jgi:hypothetical protein
MNNGFTFYGDLLGVSSLYKLDTLSARDKLNEFYNTMYFGLKALRIVPEGLMISDCVLFWGDDPAEALRHLGLVYANLLKKSIFLRGAMVKGTIVFEPRIELKKFPKMLPTDDTLARAVGLEKVYKGARLIIENSLGKDILASTPQWMTASGYNSNVTLHPQNEDVLRRICPAPEDDGSFEYLYYWTTDTHDVEFEYTKELLDETRKMVSKDIGQHYRSTIDLLDRSFSRAKFTKRKINMNL